MFAGTNNGVYMSTNSGTNWGPANEGFTEYHRLFLAMSNGTLFAGTYYNGVFASKDNGATWYSASSA